jgi:hypothetical protein
VRYREQVALRGLAQAYVDCTDVRPRDLAWPL